MSNKNWTRRDSLVESEKFIRTKIWKNNIKTVDENLPKFFITFPYPYMNGRLHLGHAYTLSKADFIARYKSLKGFNVLFPFGFHGTGMPIVACANKLKKELENIRDKEIDITKFKPDSQTVILHKMNIPLDEIPNFKDPYYWIKYFPIKAKDDLKMFGLDIDFSRSFITTNINPYYDSFIKWQFNILNKIGVLKLGNHPVIYSELDNQSCGDDDRSVGEEVGIKNFTLLKLKIVDTNCEVINKMIEEDVYILIATTRVETMPIMTNLWINPDCVYHIFKYGNEFYVAQKETVKNLIHQLKDNNEIMNQFSISGSELVGTTVRNDIRNIFKEFEPQNVSIYGLGVQGDRGTGIVASVPSHSVEDFQNYVSQNIGDPNKLKGVISINDDPNFIPNMLTKCLKSAKNEKDWEKIKKKIFNLENSKESYLSYGDFKNMSLPEIQQKIKEKIISNNLGFDYYEPEELVISRSGDRCIVAIIEQWFIDYGNEEYTEKINKYLETFETYNPSISNQLKKVSEWLKEWPCSRSAGLGTKLLNTDYLIDSLSDSTIYMAFYTVSHKIGRISTEYINDKFWNYLFLENTNDRLMEYISDFPDIDKDFQEFLIKTMNELQKEFQYWYPVDIRISGKDLVGNHLVMCLYNHAFVFDKSKWPQSYQINGHLLLNGQKMSKSKGTFLTLETVLKKYGADATRIALAEAGSLSDDGNFTEINAESAILKLYVEKEWCLAMIKELSQNIEKMNNEFNFWDNVFDNEINVCICETDKYYNEMDFYKALNSGFYSMLSARDSYRSKYENGVTGINYILVLKYIENHLLLLYPICPFYSESVWNFAESVGINFNKKWTNPNPKINIRYKYYKDNFDSILNKIRGTITSFAKRKAKNNSFELDMTNLTLSFKIITGYTKEENIILKEIKESLENNKSIDEIVRNKLQNHPDKKNCAKFINFIKSNVDIYGQEWFDIVLNNNEDENNIMKKWLPVILKDKIKKFDIKYEEPNENTKFKFGPWNGYLSLS